MRLLDKIFRSNPGDSTSRRRFLRSLGIFGGLGLIPVSRSVDAAAADAVPESTMAAEPLLGEIIMFAGNFAPRGWAFCDGQLLPINQNQALFSILGSTYGGDGRTTFALPDLRGRFPLHPGSGPGLTSRNLGEKAGEEAVTLTVPDLPSHSHSQNASSGEGAFDSPQDAVPARPASGIPQYATGSNTTMSSAAIGPTGGGRAHNNMPPYQGVHFIIALTGVFPSRN